MLGLLRRLLTPERSADIRRGPARLLRLRCGRWRWPARITRLWLRRPATLRSTRLRAAMTAPVCASISAPVSASVSSPVAAITAPVTPAARRWRAAITRAIVPIARARASVISAATANNHAGLNDRPAIAITRFVAWRVARVGGGIGCIAATGGVSGRAVRVDGATGDQGRRSEDQACNCEFHHERGGIP